MIQLRHSVLASLLSVCMAVNMVLPLMAVANTELPLNDSGVVSNQDRQYFQEVASRWIPANKEATSPAVLKGAVSMTNSPYRLGEGDILMVSIPDMDLQENSHTPAAYDEVSMKNAMEVVVRNAGEVTIPPFGTFNVEGMTVRQVSAMLEEMAKFYLVNPRVFVMIKAQRPFNVQIAGEIRRPGPYQLLSAPERAYLAYVDIADIKLESQQFFLGKVSILIGKAGGILPSSDIEHVQITNAETGKNITVNLLAMLEGDSAQDVTLEPGDLVTIPRVARTNFQSDLVASSILAPKQQTIHLLGYVNRAFGLTGDGLISDVTLAPRDMYLLSALSKVNVDPRANIHRILIFRRDVNNQLERFEVDATKENFALAPDDVVYVPHLRKNYQLQNIMQTLGSILGGTGALTNAIKR